MVAIAKNSETITIAIFSRTARYIRLKFCMKYKWDLAVDWYQNEKKNCSGIRSQWPFENLSRP